MFSLLSFVLVPLAAGVLMYLMPVRVSKAAAIIVQMALCASAVNLFLDVRSQIVVSEVIGGWPAPVGLVLRVDLLSAVMVALTVFLFLLFLIHSMSQSYVKNLFLTMFLILESLLLGIFLSTDLFNVYVLIEVSTITITLLILFKKEKRAIYDGLVYMMLNIISMTFFLLGLGMLYRITGILDFMTLQERIPQVADKTALILPCSFLVTAACLKGAVFPLFSWLPKAHGTPGAPSTVSAVLSALYVKSGIYLLIRLQGLFREAFDLNSFILILGFVTAFAGIVLAMSQKDIKRILAYSTVSQIGLIMVGIGQGTEYAYYGALYHIVSHALFKAALFLIAGMIIDEYHTRNLYKIRGVFKRMPIVATAAVAAMLGVTGAPLFNGSVSKYMIKTDLGDGIYSYGLILINLGTILYFLRFASMFNGKSDKPLAHLPLNRKVVISILGFLCLAGGLAGSAIVTAVFPVTVTFSIGSYFEMLIVYVLTLAGGFVLYKIAGRRGSEWAKKFIFEPGFNQMVLAIVFFFAVNVFYLNWSIR